MEQKKVALGSIWRLCDESDSSYQGDKKIYIQFQPLPNKRVKKRRENKIKYFKEVKYHST